LQEEANFSINTKQEVIQEAVRHRLTSATPKLKEAWTEKQKTCDQEKLANYDGEFFNLSKGGKF